MFRRSKYNNQFFTPAFVALLVLAAMSACDSEKRPAIFYPVDSLVTAQIHYLTSIRAQVLKEGFLSGRRDTAIYSPKDTLGWIKELDVFRKLDIINKPVNQGSYLVDDGLIDPESNLTVKAFKSIRDLPVVYLKIYYQGSLRKPRKVEAMYSEANLLFESSRLLSMNFQQIENRTVLTSYEIRGGEKMIFGDTVVYFIKGKILVD